MPQSALLPQGTGLRIDLLAVHGTLQVQAMKRQYVEVSDSLRIVVGPGIKKQQKEWVEDDTKLRISSEYTSRSEPDKWKPGRGGLQFEPEHVGAVLEAILAQALEQGVEVIPTVHADDGETYELIKERLEFVVPTASEGKVVEPDQLFIVGDELYFDKSCKFNTYSSAKKSRATVITVQPEAVYEVAKIKNGRAFLDELDGPTAGQIWVSVGAINKKIDKGRISVTEGE